MSDEHPAAGLEEAERELRTAVYVHRTNPSRRLDEAVDAYVAAVRRAEQERWEAGYETRANEERLGYHRAFGEREPAPDTGEDRAGLEARVLELNHAPYGVPQRDTGEDRLGYECPDCGEPVCNHVVLRERQARERADRDEALERGRAEGVAACVAALHNPIGYVGHGSPMWLLTQGFGRYLSNLDVDGTALDRLLAEAREEGRADEMRRREQDPTWQRLDELAKDVLAAAGVDDNRSAAEAIARREREAAARALEEAREKLMGGHATYRRPGKDEPWPVVAEGDVLAWLAEEIAALRTTTEDA